MVVQWRNSDDEKNALIIDIRALVVIECEWSQKEKSEKLNKIAAFINISLNAHP